MTDTTRTSRTAGYLEKIFRKINADFFGNELEEPIITIQSTPCSYGHVTAWKAWKRKEQGCYELNISADYIRRDICEVVATMIHECVHIYCMQKGIKDTSRQGQYHNKQFKYEAEKRGLIISKDEHYGWTITEPSEKLIQWCIDNDLNDIVIGRTPDLKPIFGKIGKLENDEEEKPKPKSHSIKYKCPKCGNSVRATKVVNIICADCNEKMIEC